MLKVLVAKKEPNWMDDEGQWLVEGGYDTMCVLKLHGEFDDL